MKRTAMAISPLHHGGDSKSFVRDSIVHSLFVEHSIPKTHAPRALKFGSKDYIGLEPLIKTLPVLDLAGFAWCNIIYC
jgi:hypothetical protein